MNMTLLTPHTIYPLLVVISGPSGVGKDSVIRRLQERNAPIHFVVNATSRPPRPGEVNGKDYWFVTEDEFQAMIAQDELLEYALVFDQYKGIPRKQIRDAMASGRDVILRVDVQGAQTIRAACPDAVMIFLVPESMESLATRMQHRSADTPEQIALRLKTAPEEIARLPEFDYVVTNGEGKLDRTVDIILAILLAEHCRTQPRKVSL
jgi:guanylate kinase